MLVTLNFTQQEILRLANDHRAPILWGGKAIFFFSGGVSKGRVLPKGTVSLAYALPRKNFGGGWNPPTPVLATSLVEAHMDYLGDFFSYSSGINTDPMCRVSVCS